MFTLDELLARLRQWKFAKPFRVEPARWQLLAQALASDKAADDADGRPPNGSSLSVDESFAIRLCNDYFRMQRSLAQMVRLGTETRQTRSLQRALDSLDELFRTAGIECLDPTGQLYDPGREDFESIGQPEQVPGLTRMIIHRCERPAVLIHGQIVQRAKGVVGKPATDTATSTERSA